MLGITQEMIDAVLTADASSLFNDEEKAVIAASIELTRDARISEGTFARIRPFFDDKALLELVINTSIANMNNRITDSFITDLERD